MSLENELESYRQQLFKTFELHYRLIEPTWTAETRLMFWTEFVGNPLDWPSSELQRALQKLEYYTLLENHRSEMAH